MEETQALARMGSSAASSTDSASALARLKQGHQRFLEGQSVHPHVSRERLSEVASGQNPFAAILGCADSRVPLELLFDAGLGDLFVVRNAGNTPFTAAIGSLEYAVAHLGVNLIVVLGHERCGAVSAALDFSAHLTPCLSQVVGQVRMQLIANQALEDLDQACRANVRSSALNLVGSSVLLTDRVRQGQLLVEPGYYDLDTAEIDWMGSVQSDHIPVMQ
jgi:carbonic anhydrase